MPILNKIDIVNRGTEAVNFINDVLELLQGQNCSPFDCGKYQSKHEIGVEFCAADG